MKKYFFSVFILFLLFSCTKYNFVKNYEISYDDNYKEYIVNIYGDFKDCKKLKINLKKDGKNTFEKEFSNLSYDLAFNLPIKDLEPGESNLFLICDDKKDSIKMNIWNFRSPILRYVFTNSFNSDLVTPEVEEFMESDIFINEYRDYLLSNESNFIRGANLLEFMDCKNRSDLLIEAAKKYNSKESLIIINENLKELLFENKSLDLAMVLFEKNNSNLDLEVFNILMTRPEKRIYDRFFNLFLKREHLKYALIDFLLKDGESPFFKEAVVYFKNRIVDEGLKDPQIKYFARNYFSYNYKELNFLIEMIKSPKVYKDGLFLLENFDIENNIAKQLFLNFPYYNFEVKDYLFKRFLSALEPDETIMNILLSDKNKSFTGYKLEYLMKFKNKYDERYWHFVKNLLDEGKIELYIENYLVDAPIDIKKYGYLKIYSFRKDLNSLKNLKDIDNEFYVNELISFVKEKNIYYYDALGGLAEFGDKYFDILLNAYTTEKNMEKKKDILLSILKAGERGYNFVFSEIFKRPFDKNWIDIYSLVTEKADETHLYEILNGIDEYPKDIFVDITRGLEAGRKKIDCNRILKSTLDKRNSKEEINRVIWTWAYCCPNTFSDLLDMPEKYFYDEEIIIEVIYSIIDLVKVLNIDVSRKGIDFAKYYYEKFKTKNLKLRVAELINEVGSKEDLDYIISLLAGETEDYYIDTLNSYIDSFKAKHNITNDNS